MDHFCAPWQNVCWYNMGNICCTKLKIQLQRLTKLIFMWSKAQNDLTNFWWLSRVQKINSANCNQFLTFLPSKLCNSCPNDLKFLEKVLLVELNKQCKTHDHWNIFGQVTMFQRIFFFLENWKRPVFGHFWEIFFPNFCKWSLHKFLEVLLLDNIYMICMIHDRSSFFAPVTILEKNDFFGIFLSLQAKFTSWIWRHSKNLMLKLAFRIFQYISKI